MQDRHAAPRITRAVMELAALDEIEVIVVTRGGGSLADLFCFCDETLCRTVALLAVPIVASVGHHTDRTLLDDVAAVSCSTPTHAAEAAVPLDCAQARERVRRDAGRLAVHGRRAVVDRARTLAGLSRAPGAHLARERGRLHQSLREMRAAAQRGTKGGRERTARRAVVLERKVQSARLDGRRRQRLDALAAALGAHDPQRMVERGFALVEDPAGGVITSAATARERGALRLRFGDGAVDATVDQ
ncbi:MAG TPA: exodeoxyribonuclease VII large subunit [Solirubrobacteraceae bacterium]|nr:exodeoxyribonuclease VII large subunit [Solirubrobacteraceae bacterium]